MSNSKRDLIKDLDYCQKATAGPWYVPKFKDGSPLPAVHLGDGSKPGRIVCDLSCVKDAIENAKFIAQAREGWPHAIERALKAESLARELTEVLRLYEQWEADLLMDHSLWQSASGLPFITQEFYDRLLSIQEKAKYSIARG